MRDIVNRLELKWGKFETDTHYLKQCDMSNGRCVSYLNILFNPLSREKYDLAEKRLKCKLHPQLKLFYQKYNGIMLFFESLRIYGAESNEKALYDPYDIVVQNELEDLQQQSEDFSNMIIFGYYSSCFFCYDKTNMAILYVIDTKTKAVVHEFKTVEDLLQYYLDYLIEEYDAEGKKIHFNPKYKGLPMANISTEFI